MHQLCRDWSASTFAGYWAMQPRVHQAFLRSKSKCWSQCAQQHPGDANRHARLQCVTSCYEPAQSADRATAAAAGLRYEQMQTPLLMKAAYAGFQPKFVVLLRNPMDRLHSAWWTYGHYWQRYGGKSAQGFLAYVTEQAAGFRNCTHVSKETTFMCALYLESLSQTLEDIFFHCDQLIRGMYSIWLHIWFSFFPRDDFLVLQAEEYFTNPRATMRKIFAHLGLKEPSHKEWDHILDASNIRSAARGHEMLPGAQRAVQRFYTPFNEDLVSLLGDDKWRWDASTSKGRKQSTPNT